MLSSASSEITAARRVVRFKFKSPFKPPYKQIPSSKKKTRLASMRIELGQLESYSGLATAFMQSLKIYTEAAKLHTLETGQPVAASASGEIPPGFETYIQASRWEGVTPIGGVWDAEMNAFGITSAIGVHFNGTGETRAVGYMAQIDAEYDDGNLATGAFRQLDGDRYYWIIID